MHLVGMITLLILLSLRPENHHPRGQDITPTKHKYWSKRVLYYTINWSLGKFTLWCTYLLNASLEGQPLSICWNCSFLKACTVILVSEIGFVLDIADERNLIDTFFCYLGGRQGTSRSNVILFCTLKCFGVFCFFVCLQNVVSIYLSIFFLTYRASVSPFVWFTLVWFTKAFGAAFFRTTFCVSITEASHPLLLYIIACGFLIHHN
jgi:hypothetical protein